MHRSLKQTDWKQTFCLLCLGWSLAACTSANSTHTPTPTRTPILAPATPRLRIIPSWTPTPPGSPTITLTPHPTATPYTTPEPFVTQTGALPRSTPVDLFSRPWLDRLSFAAEDQPFSLFELRYNPAVWRVESTFSLAGLGYQLSHRRIQGCMLVTTTGGNATPSMTVEYGEVTLGSMLYQTGRATENESLAFITYCTSSTEASTCFILRPGSDGEQCIVEAESALATISIVTNPLYQGSPYRWTCRDEEDNPGLCMISYTIPLNAFAFSDRNAGWAVGEDGLILGWDGVDWTAATVPATTSLYDIAFTDAAHGWVVGAGGLILRWDGTNWMVDQPFSEPGQSIDESTIVLYALDFSAVDKGWAVGAAGYPDNRVQPYLLHWDGHQWQAVVGLPACESCGLNAVLAHSATDVWVAGGGAHGALLWHWDGESWTDTPVSGASWLYALVSGKDGEVWAAGLEQATSPFGVTTQRGVVLQWNGNDWEALILPPHSGGLYALEMLPDGSLAVGGDFTLLGAGGEWAYINTEIEGFGWIVEIVLALDGTPYALTRAGALFEFALVP
jgi:hypothetical protein